MTDENEKQETYISLEDASRELGVARTTFYYYTKQLSIETKKFPLDRYTYISHADFEKIKKAKKDAKERKH